jgi:hypothetical protein
MEYVKVVNSKYVYTIRVKRTPKPVASQTPDRSPLLISRNLPCLWAMHFLKVPENVPTLKFAAGSFICSLGEGVFILSQKGTVGGAPIPVLRTID